MENYLVPKIAYKWGSQGAFSSKRSCSCDLKEAKAFGFNLAKREKLFRQMEQQIQKPCGVGEGMLGEELRAGFCGSGTQGKGHNSRTSDWADESVYLQNIWTYTGYQNGKIGLASGTVVKVSGSYMANCMVQVPDWQLEIMPGMYVHVQNPKRIEVKELKHCHPLEGVIFHFLSSSLSQVHVPFSKFIIKNKTERKNTLLMPVLFPSVLFSDVFDGFLIWQYELGI